LLIGSSRASCTDRVAVIVFEQAQRGGELVSMNLVKRVIADLGVDAALAPPFGQHRALRRG
jgi:hypothetical protein